LVNTEIELIYMASPCYQWVQKNPLNEYKPLAVMGIKIRVQNK